MSRRPFGAQEAALVADFWRSHPAQLEGRAGTVVTVLPQRAQDGPSWASGYLRCSLGHDKGFLPRSHLVFLHGCPLDAARGVPGTVRFPFSDPNPAFLSVHPGQPLRVLGPRPDAPDWLECVSDDARGLIPRSYVSFRPPLPSPFQALAELFLLDPQLRLVRHLGNIVKPTSADQVGKNLLELFTLNFQELDLMEAVISSEVAACTSQGTLFRRNSINSAALAAFARAQGSAYLALILGPTLEKVASGSESYEIDPARIQSPDELERNVQNVAARSHELLDRLIATADQLPTEIGQCCDMLAQEVARKMPDAARNMAIGGFLMLRFICPPIAASMSSFEGAVKLPAVPADRRRGLVLISKVIINLVNDVEFGKKEDFMAPLEKLMRESGRAKLSLFFDKVLAASQKEQWISASAGAQKRRRKRSPLDGPVDADEASLELLHLSMVQDNVPQVIEDETLASELEVALRAGRHEVAKQAEALVSKAPSSALTLKTAEGLKHLVERLAALERLTTVTADKKERKKVTKEIMEVFGEIQKLRISFVEHP